MNSLKIHFMLLFLVLENIHTVNGFFVYVLSGSCDVLWHVLEQINLLQDVGMCRHISLRQREIDSVDHSPDFQSLTR